MQVLPYIHVHRKVHFEANGLIGNVNQTGKGITK